jgi:hypothetical protein
MQGSSRGNGKALLPRTAGRRGRRPGGCRARRGAQPDKKEPASGPGRRTKIPPATRGLSRHLTITSASGCTGR